MCLSVGLSSSCVVRVRVCRACVYLSFVCVRTRMRVCVPVHVHVFPDYASEMIVAEPFLHMTFGICAYTLVYAYVRIYMQMYMGLYIYIYMYIRQGFMHTISAF